MAYFLALTSACPGVSIRATMRILVKLPEESKCRRPYADFRSCPRRGSKRGWARINRTASQQPSPLRDAWFGTNAFLDAERSSGDVPQHRADSGGIAATGTSCVWRERERASLRPAAWL